MTLDRLRAGEAAKAYPASCIHPRWLRIEKEEENATMKGQGSWKGKAMRIIKERDEFEA
jgi:hypothetical protein